MDIRVIVSKKVSSKMDCVMLDNNINGFCF
jgi:hypothetical protein